MNGCAWRLQLPHNTTISEQSAEEHPGTRVDHLKIALPLLDNAQPYMNDAFTVNPIVCHVREDFSSIFNENSRGITVTCQINL